MSQYKPNIIERISTRILGRRPPINESIQAESRKVQAYHGKGLKEYSGYNDIFLNGKNGLQQLSIARTKSYFQWYVDDSTVRSGINALAETAVGMGYHTVMPTGYPTEYDRDGEEITAKEKEIIDEYGRILNLDDMMPNICRLMLVSGFCPVERKFTKFPRKSKIKIIHPSTVKYIHVDDYGEFDYLIQADGSTDGRKFTKDDVTLFTYNQLGNDVSGLGLVETVENLLSIKHSALNNMEGMIERYISPIHVWMSTGDITPIQNALAHHEAGEDIFLGNLPDFKGDYEEFKFIPVEVKGDAKFKEFIDFVDQLIWIGINSPNQMYWRNATEASATVLEDMIDKNINAIQRNMARGMEEGFFTRILEANGYNIDENIVPRVSWGVETTGTEDIMPSDIITKGLDLFYITEDDYRQILSQMGIKIKWSSKAKRVEPSDDDEEPVPDDAGDTGDVDDSGADTDTE